MKVCRACLKIIRNPECYNLNQSYPNLECSVLKDKCKACIPELDLKLTSDPVLCNSCYNTFNLFYQLRLKCLNTQEKIRNLLREKRFVDLYVLAQQNQTSAAENCTTPVVKIEWDEDLDVNISTPDAPENFASSALAPREISDLEELFETETVSIHLPYDNTISELVNDAEVLNNQKNSKNKTRVLTQSTSSAEFIESKVLSRRSQKEFKCSDCNYNTSYQINLKKHKRHHKCNKPFVCKVCGFTALEKWLLHSHMAMHSDKKPLKCKTFDYKTAYESTMITHSGKHTGEKPYRCNICDNLFMQYSNLKSHIKTHFNVDWYKCTMCAYKTFYKAHLRNHIKLHTGEKQYVCKVCDQKFSHKITLTRHIKYHQKYHLGNAQNNNENSENINAENIPNTWN